MRKVSREMPAEWAYEVFEKAPYVTVSMVTKDGEPYAVPLSLVHGDGEHFYFHCALEGKKNEVWEEYPKVWLSAVRKCKPTVGPKDGSFTLEYESAMAAGKVIRVTENEECISAMRALCIRFLPNHMDHFKEAIDRSLHRTAVYRIDLTEIPTGKRKQYGANGEELKYGKEA
jgi:hypothetical protein